MYYIIIILSFSELAPSFLEVIASLEVIEVIASLEVIEVIASLGVIASRKMLRLNNAQTCLALCSA